MEFGFDDGGGDGGFHAPDAVQPPLHRRVGNGSVRIHRRSAAAVAADGDDDGDGMGRARGGGGGGGGNRRRMRRDGEDDGGGGGGDDDVIMGDGGGGGGGGNSSRQLHFDPEDALQEDTEDVVLQPLESMQWVAKPRYQAQLPVGEYCYMCEIAPDHDNPFYVALQAIANAPTLDEEARCVHMARMYAQHMQQGAGDARLPDWKELAVYRHLTEHDISHRRVLHTAVVRTRNLLDAYGATMMRYKRDMSGALTLQPPDCGAAKTFITVLNMWRMASKELHAVNTT